MDACVGPSLVKVKTLEMAKCRVRGKSGMEGWCESHIGSWNKDGMLFCVEVEHISIMELYNLKINIAITYVSCSHMHRARPQLTMPATV